jgi:hypothetical protein
VPTLEALEERSLPSSSSYLSDPGFEAPAAGQGNYLLDPSTSPWTFGGTAGLTGNNSPYTSGNPAAPQGAQVALLQGYGSVSQTMTVPGGAYNVGFSAAQRANAQAGSQTFQVLIDGTAVGTFNSLAGNSYTPLTTGSFALAGTSHTLTFQGTDLHGGDNTVFLDSVSLNPVIGLSDPGFETPPAGSSGYVYDPAFSPWSFSGNAGLTTNNSPFTNGNPPAPQGVQVAFLQGYGGVSQTTTLPTGTYTVTFSAAQRANMQASSQTFQVLIDGTAVGTFNTFTGSAYTILTTGTFSESAGSHTLTIQGTDLKGGDNTIFIDQVSINMLPSLGDSGFEAPGVGSSAYLFNPTGTPWTFSGDAGVTSNNSAYTSGNPAAPQGAQVAFLQGFGSISQTTALPAGTYSISFSAAQRGNTQASSQTLQVLVDGSVVGTFNSFAGTAYQTLSTGNFTLAVGLHTVTLKGTDLHGGDNTAFVDMVTVNYWASLGDPGFETPAAGSTGYVYDPTTSPWTFSGNAGQTNNGSPFTGSNPPAPQGSQVAFLQGFGSVSQTTALPAGTYTVMFSAAQRGNTQASRQTFEVLVDGIVVAAFNYFTGSTYAVLSTGNFTVTSGVHTLTFQGTDLLGGDNTAFLDQVSLVGRISPNLPPPTATFVNLGPVNAGSSVVVAFSGAAGGTGGYTYSYDFNNTGTFDITNSTATQATVPASDLTTSTHVVHGRITDSSGAYTDYATVVQVNDLSSITLSPATLPNWTVNKSGLNQTITATGGTGPYTFAVSAGTVPTGLILSSPSVLSGTPTVASSFSFTITATDSLGATGSANYTVTINPAVTISTTSLVNWTVNRSGYNQTISATGGTGALAFSSTGTLPIGLTLSATGVLSGTPSSAGSFSFTLTATDTVGATGSKSYTVVINPAVKITTTTLANWTVNRSGYSQTISATGGTGAKTFATSSGTLPSGLSLNTSGVLAGTPSAAGTYNFTVTATDTVGATASQSYTVTINPVVTITTSSLASGTVNQAGYSQTVSASGGTGALSFNASGTLPPGLTLSSAGVLSGTPSTAGSFTFTVTATDSVGATGSKSFTVVINSSSGTGHTYYVATTGSDSNSGSASAPFATLQHAMIALNPGDTLIVRAGNYAGFILGWDSIPTSSGDQYGWLNGTATAPITIEADPSAAPGSVIINSRNNETRYGIDIEPGNSYLDLIGFTIADTGNITTSSSRGGGIKIASPNIEAISNTITNIVYGFGIIADNADNVGLQGNTISGTGNQGNADYGHAIYLSGSTNGAVVKGNVIYNNAYIGLHVNGDLSEGGIGLVTNALIADNLIYNNGQNGINADGLQSSTIENNLIYGYQGFGIALYQIDAAAGSKNNVIVNNTIVSTVSGAGAAVRILDASTGNTLLNNILLGGGGIALRISSDSMSGLDSDYNIGGGVYQSEDTGTTQTLAQWQSSNSQDAHSFIATASQLFVNAASSNYQLSSTSPAINAGTSTDAPSTDLLGNPRPSGGGFDVGCYQ